MAKFKCHVQATTTAKIKVPATPNSFSEMGNKVKKEVMNVISQCSNDLSFGDAAIPTPHAEESMATSFTRPPFSYQGHGQEEDNKVVNRILQFSLRLQKEEEISNCSGFVTYVVSICMRALDIPCKVEAGHRRVDSESSPHMWLVINDNIVDNCYWKSMPKSSIKSLEKKYPKCYESTSFNYSSYELKSYEKEVVSTLKTKKLIDLFKEFPDKALALCLNREDLTNYFFAMIRFIWDKHKINIKGISPAIRYVCWCCRKYPALSDTFLSDIVPEQLDISSVVKSPNTCADGVKTRDMLDGSTGTSWKFRVCAACKVASYCSRSCQETDWKNQHKFTCRKRTSVCLLPADRDTN